MPESERLPIFPLSNVVVFPRVRCPLHIFEPRYRQMTLHAIESDRRIGMATVLPEHVGEMAGDPPVFQIGCAGTIAEHQLLPDGRFNLVLVGTQRFRICREPERSGERLYRVAEVQFLADPFDASDAGRILELRSKVIALAHELVSEIAPGRAAAFASERLTSVDDAVLVNALCNALPFPAPEKQGLLESAGVLERYEKLEGLLCFRLAELGMGALPDSQRLH